MSKNLIYMVAIDHSSSKYKNSDYSQYSINSWKSWCKINNVDFKVVAEHDERLGKPIWNKELIFERSAGYDKIESAFKVGTNWLPYTAIVNVFIVNTNLLKPAQLIKILWYSHS